MQAQKVALDRYRKCQKRDVFRALAAAVACLGLGLSVAAPARAQDAPAPVAIANSSSAGSSLVSQTQLQRVLAALESAAQDSERLNASMNRLYPRYGTERQGEPNLSELNPAIDDAVRLRGSLSGLIRQLRALPKNGTPEQAIALRNTLNTVAGLTSELETIVRQLSTLSRNLE